MAIVELAPGHDTDALAHGGEAVDIGAAGLRCRRLAAAAWPHPLIVADRQTIVTGDEALLRGLARRTDAHLESAPLDRLLLAMNPEADALLLVNLAAARAAHWKLPTALADVWPLQKQRWHNLWETPAGLGCTLWWSESPRSELALVCESETTTQKVYTDLDAFVPAVKRLLEEGLKEIDRWEPDKAAAADPYRKLLEDGQEVLDGVHPQVADGIVKLCLNWKRSPLELAATAIEGFPFMRDGWLAAGRGLDEENHRHIQTALLAFQKAEGHFPAGAGGGTLLPPETRLSWIAALLPYFGHADWHRQLEFGYSWNGPPNRLVSQRPLAEVINPVLGPAATQAGFPVTHYVGVAGVGPDAGRLAVDDPRAGVFGDARTARPADITRGTANCIAVLGVGEHCGAWAAGGEATVRSLTQRPYVNGPDGFGSGQPGGMVAGMADGSVRFISKDVDPGVLEHLATIHGNDGVTVAALDRTPRGPARRLKVPSSVPARPRGAGRRTRRARGGKARTCRAGGRGQRTQASPGRQAPQHRASRHAAGRRARHAVGAQRRADRHRSGRPGRGRGLAGRSGAGPSCQRHDRRNPGEDPRRPQARLHCRGRPAAGHHAGGLPRNAPWHALSGRRPDRRRHQGDDGTGRPGPEARRAGVVAAQRRSRFHPAGAGRPGRRANRRRP